MKLSQDQIAQFHETGYLMLPNLFFPAEAGILKQAAAKVWAMDREEVVRKKDGSTPRTAFAAHRFNEAFRRLGRHPRLVEPVMQLLDDPVYVHQYKVNAKTAFAGDVWQWHQDYDTWSRDDLMPEARAMNIALFIDDVTEFNGPLWIIPQSYREGVYKVGHDLQATGCPLWTLDKEKGVELAEAGGICSAKGGAGSVLMFHGNIVHASSPNLSP